MKAYEYNNKKCPFIQNKHIKTKRICGKLLMYFHRNLLRKAYKIASGKKLVSNGKKFKAFSYSHLEITFNFMPRKVEIFGVLCIFTEKGVFFIL